MTAFISALTISLLLATPCFARVLMTQDDALKLAFPEGQTVERRSAFLTAEQKKEIQTRAHAKVESELINYYVGRSSGGIEGYAFFDSHIVRTMPESFMAVMNPDGSVRFVEILSFYEPEDYRPPKRWLDLFKTKSANDPLRIKRDVRNVTGATLTSQAMTDAVRRLLATFEVLIKNDSSEKGK